MGYFTVDQGAGHGYCSFDYLNSLPASYESDTVRVVSVDEPLAIGIDGRKGEGVVAKPGYLNNQSTEN